MTLMAPLENIITILMAGITAEELAEWRTTKPQVFASSLTNTVNRFDIWRSAQPGVSTGPPDSANPLTHQDLSLNDLARNNKEIMDITEVCVSKI